MAALPSDLLEGDSDRVVTQAAHKASTFRFQMERDVIVVFKPKDSATYDAECETVSALRIGSVELGKLSHSVTVTHRLQRRGTDASNANPTDAE